MKAEEQADQGNQGERACLVFDGECEFCRGWAARWRRIAGSAVECIPAKDAVSRFPGQSAAGLEKALHLVEPGGKVTRGVEAALRAWAFSGRSRFPLWLYRRVPGMAGLMEAVYRFVARHRHRDVSRPG